MNEKITEVFNKIFSSRDLLSKFMLIDDADELYKFCLDIEKGYSKAEFEDYLMKLADECLFQTETIENEMIAGGTSNFKKFVSSSLAAATILSSTGIRATDTASNEIMSGYTDLEPLDNQTKIIQKEEKTFFQKIKEKFKKIGSKIWDNKGKIAIGSAIVAAIVATSIYIKTKSNKKNETKDENKNGNKPSEKASIFSSIFSLGALGLTSTMLIVDKVASLLGNITKIGETVDKGAELVNKLKTNGEIFGKYLAENEEKTFEEREKDFYEHLKYVRGQDVAVNKLKEIMQDISKSEQMDKEAKKSGKTQQKKSPRVIILNGPSGSGKTLCAEMLAKALSPNGEYKKIAAQNIKYDGSKNEKGLTPAEDIFNYKPSYWGTKDNLGKYASDNPNGVAILDEYDKIGLGNGYSDVMEGHAFHPLDATFQSIYDNGCYENPESSKIPLENFTFILTTNEVNESLGLPPSQTTVTDENGNKENKEKFTSFRTNPLHSSHFKDRFKNSVVTFDDLDENAFKQIAEDDLKSRLDFYMSLDVCGKCNFKIKNDAYKKIAEYILELREDAKVNPTIVSPPSARIIVDYHNGITAEAPKTINNLYTARQKLVAKNLINKYGKELNMSETDILKKLMFIPGKMTFTIDFNYHRNNDGVLINDGFKIECIDNGNYSDDKIEQLKNLVKKK